MIEQLEGQSTLTIAGHRGWKSAYPENTLLSFYMALELGVQMIEFDLRLSKDKCLMVIHDETVDRTTNGMGRVRDYTLAELKQLDAGGWFSPTFEGLKIPTLDELCELLSSYPDVLLNVEIKSSEDAKEAVDAAVALLGEYGYLSRCVFTCFDAEVLGYIHDRYHMKTQGFPARLMSNYVHGEEGTISKMWAVAFSMKLLFPEDIEPYREAGKLVWCYCPDTEEEVQFSWDCGIKLMTVNDLLPAMRLRSQLNESAMLGSLKE
ncbi:glycerophosphodiester phosphodiesterase family protein [Paenibacillus dakarensis]|uniref:glycerophosphodiester phosphodiesterase family protein n=1 Tax=Paenibacillus dakarensis TaxID=1527293 RepID=UPI0006D55882|nr:glycerophosphodiester phosphodiesterase family protein [Paenibacillus dakarensis]